jgi:peptide-methionine (S)-S-oxide reductase
VDIISCWVEPGDPSACGGCILTQHFLFPAAFRKSNRPAYAYPSEMKALMIWALLLAAAGGESFAQTGGKTMEKATFGAGCFWGVEAAFRTTKGVTSTSVGYEGGKTKNPTYEDVCSHATGHAEVVQVEFDPKQVSYDQLLDLFWKIHDPTQLNRQGPDVGDQYRSAIFFHSPDQEKAAKASKEKLEKSGKLKRPVATAIVPAEEFWKAEEYHQQYLAKKGLSHCKL